VGKAHAIRRIGNADKMFARRALDLPPGELWLALQRLFAMGTIKLEFGCVHAVIQSAETSLFANCRRLSSGYKKWLPNNSKYEI
jgi:hypothetical protein